jgi:hypothetical protein
VTRYGKLENRIKEFKKIMIRNVQVLRSTLQRRGRIRLGSGFMARLQYPGPVLTENRLINLYHHNLRGTAPSRCFSERSSGSYAARSQLGYDTLAEIYILACQSWLSLGLHSEIALNQAEDHLALIGERYFAGDTEYPVLDLLEALVQARLQHGTSQSLRCAVKLLVWWTDHDSSKKYEDALASLFHKALAQSVKAEDRAVARDLLDRMQLLLEEARWNSISPDDETTSKVLLIEPLGPTPEVAYQRRVSAAAKEERQLSPFEIEALERNFQKVLQSASVKDLEKVKKVVARLESQTSLSRDLIQALVQYYLKIKKANEATEWLRKLESFTEDVGDAFLGDVYRELLALWLMSSENTTEIPWRVQEILDRMEQLEAKCGAQLLNTKDFNSVMRCWGNTESSIGQQKIAALFDRMEQARKNGISAKSPDLSSYTLLLSSLSLDSMQAETTLDVISDAWHVTPGTRVEKEKLLEELLRAYASVGMGSQASRLVRLAKSEELGISESCGQSLLEAHVTSGDLSVLADELHYLEQNLDIPLPPVSYYRIVLTALLKVHDARDTFKQELSLLDRALARCRDENKPSIDDISNMQEMMKSALWKMKWQKRAIDADKALRHFREFHVVK